MTDRTEEVSSLFMLLGDATRIRICRMLAEEGELKAGEIRRRLGLTLAGVSRHLALLRAASVVAWRREGKFVFYSLARDARTRLAPVLLYALGMEGAKISKAPAR